jgi:SAM-dependent methyltransferase
MTAFKDHFSSHAAGYASYRPTYPQALVDYLAGVAPGHQLSLDCGCGTGQLSVLLAERFGQVIATDASAQQIEQAQAHPRVTYRVAPAEQSGLADGSADLVTVAQAAHWFDLPAFYDEVRRVARPHGVLALITYGVLHVGGDADPVVQHFYGNVLGPYWPPERRLVEEGYRSLPFPFAEIEAPPMEIRVEWSVAELVGYIDTWSAVRALEKSAGRGSLETFKQELAGVWGNPEARRPVRFPLALRVGRVG